MYHPDRNRIIAGLGVVIILLSIQWYVNGVWALAGTLIGCSLGIGLAYGIEWVIKEASAPVKEKEGL